MRGVFNSNAREESIQFTGLRMNHNQVSESDPLLHLPHDLQLFCGMVTDDTKMASRVLSEISPEWQSGLIETACLSIELKVNTYTSVKANRSQTSLPKVHSIKSLRIIAGSPSTQQWLRQQVCLLYISRNSKDTLA